MRDASRKTLERVRAAELLDMRIGQLSCGQLQRVLLALALSPVPELLLLDEPLAGMDHPGTLLFYQIVSEVRLEMDLSILLVSHDLAAAAGVADRIVYLNRTVLCDGAPVEVLKSRQVREVFGLDIETVPPTTAPLARKGQCCPPGGRKK